MRHFHGPNISLHPNNAPLRINTEAKFLGLIIDHRLTWKTQKKRLVSLNILKLSNNKSFDPLIRSKLDYGSSVYNSASNHWLQTLEPVQNASLRLALRVFPTSSRFLEFLLKLNHANVQEISINLSQTLQFPDERLLIPIIYFNTCLRLFLHGNLILPVSYGTLSIHNSTQRL